MENLVKRLTSQQVALIVLIALLMSLLSIFSFKLKLSPDFNASQVAVIQLDHEVSLDEVGKVASSVANPVRIDKESTGKFYFYFQNPGTDNIADFINNFKGKQAGVLTTEVYNFKPWGELYLRERVVIIAVIGLIVFLGFSTVVMRKSGISRKEMLEFLMSDMFSLFFSILVLLGVGSILGVYGQTMSISYWDMFLLGVAVVIILKLYRTLRMRDILEKNKYGSLVEAYHAMYKKYWPELVFIFAFVLLSATLPWLVLQGKLVWAAMLPAMAAIVAGFNFVFVDYNFLKFLTEWNFINSKTLTRLNLSKKW